MPPTNRHEGRVVLVTGGGSGLGRAIAIAFAKHGAAVGVIDIDGDAAHQTVAGIAEAGLKAHAVQGDVARFKDVERAATEIATILGPIDTLINNAGISPKKDGAPVPALEMDPEEWRRVVEVNLTGCFNTVRLVAPAMKERGFGAIVNQSSVAGRAYVDFVAVHYSATKAALIGFTRHLAGELGPFGITVNAIAPGRIETPMVRTVPGQVNEAIRLATPLRRLGQPEDVASLAVYLTSAEARFITGQVCDVSGGWLMT